MNLTNVFFHVIKDHKTMQGKFESNTFDFIFSIATLHHMEKEDVWCYLKVFHNLLKRNGVVCLDFPDFSSDESFKVFVENAVSGNRFLTRMHYFTLEEIEILMKRANFKIKSISPHYRFSGKYLVLAEKE